MKVGIAVWNSRVSPVFDTAKRLLVIDLVDGIETGREEIAMTDVYPALRVQRLRSHGVDVLICGAISNPIAALTESAGITLMPWISGNTDEIVDAFKNGELMSPRYIMPGCKRQRRGRCRGAGGGGGGHGGQRGNRRGSQRSDFGAGMQVGKRRRYNEKEDDQ